mmetsp:Transcript_24272/g.78445  ORF Transcript_24272/g.78445 Transcript_24272/m.78445 type:complete len:274 (+) Transcript_24272:614-1435(+)
MTLTTSFTMFARLLSRSAMKAWLATKDVLLALWTLGRTSSCDSGGVVVDSPSADGGAPPPPRRLSSSRKPRRHGNKKKARRRRRRPGDDDDEDKAPQRRRRRRQPGRERRGNRTRFTTWRRSDRSEERRRCARIAVRSFFARSRQPRRFPGSQRKLLYDETSSVSLWESLSKVDWRASALFAAFRSSEGSSGPRCGVVSFVTRTSSAGSSSSRPSASSGDGGAPKSDDDGAPKMPARQDLFVGSSSGGEGELAPSLRKSSTCAGGFPRASMSF